MLMDFFGGGSRLSEASDEEVLSASYKNPGHFSILVDRYQEAFIRKVEGILHDKEAAYDVVQDAFTKIYLAGKRFKHVEGASFKSWAYRIVVNTALTEYQKRKKARPHGLELDPELYDIIPDLKQLSEAEQALERDYLVSIFSRMPRDLSRVLELHFLEGRPHEEIAQMEGSTVPAIKTRVYRAKQLFRKIAGSLE